MTALALTPMPVPLLSTLLRAASGKAVAKGLLVTSLLTNNAISLAGIGITVIGLQASVGA